jgi:DNA-binding NtrC family response regulator
LWLRLLYDTFMNTDNRPVHVLLVEDEPDLRSTLRYNIKRSGLRVTEVGNGQEALDALADAPADAPIEVIVSDVMMPLMDGLALAKAVRANPATKDLPLIFLTAKGDTTHRLDGFRAGADDYLTKPFELEELLARLHVQARRAMLTRQMREGVTPAGSARDDDLVQKVAIWEQRFPQLSVIRKGSIVGGSPKTLQVLREVLMRAPGKDPVLIAGETGTGKTGVAEAIHRLGPRANKPFRVVNCAEFGAADAAIPQAKLFGVGKASGLNHVHKDGQPGLLEDCDGGTLFFDEIHRLPLEAQAMLLLPIEGRPFHPAAGKAEPRTVDVKFIFATNVDLRTEAAAGRFPQDLYQRLAQSQIRVPSLAERREDILALAEHFLDEAKEEFELQHATLAPSLQRHLLERSYTGNIRELRTLVRELARRAGFELDTVLTVDHLPEAWQESSVSSASIAVGASNATSMPRTDKADQKADAKADSKPPLRVAGEDDDAGGLWNELELQELAALRRHRFKIAAAENELGLSSKSRTLTNHLRGMCFKALARAGADDVRGAARMVVGREDDALLDRTQERLESYVEMVQKHVESHTTDLLFNNLPRDYRKYVEQAIERARGT